MIFCGLLGGTCGDFLCLLGGTCGDFPWFVRWDMR